MSRVFAYCRVSTADQTPDNQLHEIEASGFHIEPQRVIRETISGSVAARQRPAFSKLIDRLERGDVLVVTKLDRLGRDAMDVRSTVDGFASNHIKVHCLALGGADLTSPAGRMTMGVIAAVAEFERDLIVERTRAGLDRAKAAGTRLGRRSVLTDEAKLAIRLKREGGASLGELAREFKVSRSAIQRVEKSDRNDNTPLDI